MDSGSIRIPHDWPSGVKRLDMLLLPSNVVILCWNTPTSSDNNARKIADLSGADVTVVSLPSARSIGEVRQAMPRCAALVVHIDTLAQMAEELDAGVNGLLVLNDLSAHVFIHGFGLTDGHSSILQTLSLGGLDGLTPLPPTEHMFRVTDSHREWCGQLSGLAVHTADPVVDRCFVESAPHAGQTVLIRVANQPFFVRVDHGDSDLFFVACLELADVDEIVPSEDSLLPWFSRLIPLMIFLRRALGDGLWHSDSPQACFIVDDPLLQHRYGFLEYVKLLKAAGRQKFSGCIAFIPWNYRRSNRETAALFSAAPTTLSLCVHGCDHTGAEFAATDYEVLCAKARLALERMQVHNQLSGVPFDDVMVFPQGLFSSEAVRALDACGYLAAVNTARNPLDRPRATTLRDALDVAVTAFADFPLFGRHYTRDPADFAFDLFLGKPAIVVEHHGYFRGGYEPLEAFVKQLNAFDKQLEWSNLATILSRACLKKLMPDGVINVRFYTSRFRLKNKGARSQTYLLIRRRTAMGPLPTVTVNGRQWTYDQEADRLTVRLSLDAGQTVDIRILPAWPSDATAAPWKPTNIYKAKVLIRRVLSEFRDNYVDTSRHLAALLMYARKVRAGVRPRGRRTS